MKYRIFIIALSLISFNGFSQDVSNYFSKANAFFSLNVSNGKVNYSKINANQESLNEILKLAEKMVVSKENPQTYQAFWINAYNLAVIKGIVDNHPMKSPLDKKGFFDKTTYKLGGKTITLNDIENNVLRAEFGDARFHFVLVCGALGCPPLISKAYMPKTLSAQMDKQTKIALNGSFLKINTKKNQIEVSQIMEWYKEDFTKKGTTEIDFINSYRTEPIPSNYKLSYFPYNWAVNAQ